MLDENLISTLEQSLKQTRSMQNRLISRLNEVEVEAERLREEIEGLENSAEQTTQAIYSLLATMRSGKQYWNVSKSFQVDEYEIPDEIRRPPRINQRNLNNHPKQNSQNNQNNLSNQNIPSNDYSNDYRSNSNDYSNDYRNNTVAYMNNSRHIPTISPQVKPISHRFNDRTITQACNILLREAGQPLHVNELYNFLVAGGFEFKGNNPTISIAVSLNRNRRFCKVAPGTFDLIMREASSREAAS